MKKVLSVIMAGVLALTTAVGASAATVTNDESAKATMPSMSSEPVVVEEATAGETIFLKDASENNVFDMTEEASYQYVMDMNGTPVFAEEELLEKGFVIVLDGQEIIIMSAKEQEPVDPDVDVPASDEDRSLDDEIFVDSEEIDPDYTLDLDQEMEDTDEDEDNVIFVYDEENDIIYVVEYFQDTECGYFFCIIEVIQGMEDADEDAYSTCIYIKVTEYVDEDLDNEMFVYPEEIPGQVDVENETFVNA